MSLINLKLLLHKFSDLRHHLFQHASLHGLQFHINMIHNFKFLNKFFRLSITSFVFNITHNNRQVI